LFLDIALVLVHAALPLVSLILPLPAKRNFSSPMIWPEFRLHSVAFASRHVAGTVFWLIARRDREQGKTWDGLVSMTRGQILTMLLMIHATMIIATAITRAVGDLKARTTNAMPYDKYVPDLQRKRAKKLYAFAQFQAAAFLFMGDPTIAFIPLTGIQSAPFLMTLVRKGKCSAATYHCVYTWSLILPFLVRLSLTVAGTISVCSANAAVLTGTLAFWLRTSQRLPKHAVWFVAPALVLCAFRISALEPLLSSSKLIAPIVIMCILDVSTLYIPTIMFRLSSPPIPAQEVLNAEPLSKSKRER